MANEMEEILRRVAAGELSRRRPCPCSMPQVTAGPRRARSPRRPPGGPHRGRRPVARGEPEPPTGPVRVIRVNASYRPIQVVADPAVAEAFVTGEHTVRREGGTLVVEGGLRFGGDEEGGPRFSFSQLPQTLAWARALQSDRLVVGSTRRCRSSSTPSARACASVAVRPGPRCGSSRPR